MSGYVVNTKAEQQEMLQALGMNSLDDLYVSVPEEANSSTFLKERVNWK